jgi:ElaB/YqjD/DUF883 family membrane-anchored ribosome-binding protein
MSVESEAGQAKAAAAEAVGHAEGSLRALVERLENLVSEVVDIARSRSKVYAEGASEQIETAQKYVIDHVQERPLASAATALGVGVVIGLLLSGRHR